MTIYRRKKNGSNAGHAVGVVCLNQNMPFIPGDVQCATTFDFPVVYKVAEEGTSAGILEGVPEMAGWLTEAAIDLESQGVRCVSGDSGYMVPYQKGIANAVDVPVGLSSLIQVPLIGSMFAKEQTVAIVCAASPPLDEASLAELGITIPNNLVVEGMQGDDAVVEIMFAAVNIADHGEAGDTSAGPAPFDVERLSESFYKMGRKLAEEHPNLGAILLECSDFPPYAKAIQTGAGGVPVFDFIKLINLLESGTSRVPFSGQI